MYMEAMVIAKFSLHLLIYTSAGSYSTIATTTTTTTEATTVISTNKVLLGTYNIVLCNINIC